MVRENTGFDRKKARGSIALSIVVEPYADLRALFLPIFSQIQRLTNKYIHKILQTKPIRRFIDYRL